ncbi:MAG TPA: phytanoyl-CoA dioxygenase family protein [Usitatibacter sp.]|nr:phytanoyl-CoA dioxygenase family protein [Usitatibacter sp.]
MVSHGEHEEFASQGFLAFDPQIDERTLDEAAARLRDMYLPEGEPDDRSKKVVVFRNNRRIQDAWKVIPAVKAIATAPRVLQLLESLYARKPRAFQTLNFRVGSEQQPHSDTIHFNSSPSGYMCGVWVALEDVDRDNGPVVYFPGSHKFKEVTLSDVDVHSVTGAWQRSMARLRGYMNVARSMDADYAIYEQIIRENMAASGIAPRYATIKKGQAFIWAANLIHGGSPQLDRSRTRMSQVSHYFFEGCRYYTPLLRRAFRTHWRDPDWIV